MTFIESTLPWHIAKQDPRCGPTISILGRSKEHAAIRIAEIPAAFFPSNPTGTHTTLGDWVTPNPTEAREIAETIVDPLSITALRRMRDHVNTHGTTAAEFRLKRAIDAVLLERTA